MARRSRNTSPSFRSRARRTGFTLAESLIATTVLALAVCGLFAPLSASSRQSAIVQQNSAAISLAEQLLEEIAAKPFADPTDGSLKLGPEADEGTRPYFDNIDDYHGYSDNTDELRSASGELIPWSSGERYTRSVTVEYRATPDGQPASAGHFVWVTVTVDGPSGQVSIPRLFARYATKE